MALSIAFDLIDSARAIMSIIVPFGYNYSRVRMLQRYLERDRDDVF